MQDALYTVNGDRPDLAASIIVNPPEGYIAAKILPVSPVMEKAGSVAYKTLDADVAAQTGRVAGAAPTITQIANSATTFSCAEAVKRGAITPDEVKQMGGIEKADAVGTKFAMRSVQNYLEADVCAHILGVAASASFDPAKFKTQAQTALNAVRRYEGRSTLIAGTKTIQAMMQGILSSKPTDNLFNRIVNGNGAALSLQSMVDALKFYVGIDDVLAGDDGIWNAGAYAGHFAIAKLDDGTDPLSHKWNPVLGKTFQFLPDGTNPWVIKSVADLTLVNNFYDAYQWFDTVVLNAGALYVFDGVQDA
jgi:hypothetical protein